MALRSREMCLEGHTLWKVPQGSIEVYSGPCVRFTTFHETCKVELNIQSKLPTQPKCVRGTAVVEL